MGGLMDGLRAAAQQVIGDNAVALHGEGATAGADPHWWDLKGQFAARKAKGEQIAKDVDAAYHGHNNATDAMRHAVWSQRMAQEIGPLFSTGAGVEHELDNLSHAIKDHTLGQTATESLMDLHNNLEGVGAAVSRRPINPSHLQVRPYPIAGHYGDVGQP